MSKKDRGSRHKPLGKGRIGTGRWRLRPGQQVAGENLNLSHPTNRQERRIAAARQRELKRREQ